MWGRRRYFTAAAVAFRIDEELETEYLVVAERADGDGRRIEVQRSLYEDAQDVALGQDKHCLVDERGVVVYGAIDEWSVRRERLHLRLTEDAASEFGVKVMAIDLPEGMALATVAPAMRRLTSRPRVRDAVHPEASAFLEDLLAATSGKTRRERINGTVYLVIEIPLRAQAPAALAPDLLKEPGALIQTALKILCPEPDRVNRSDVLGWLEGREMHFPPAGATDDGRHAPEATVYLYGEHVHASILRITFGQREGEQLAATVQGCLHPVDRFAHEPVQFSLRVALSAARGDV